MRWWTMLSAALLAATIGYGCTGEPEPAGKGGGEPKGTRAGEGAGTPARTGPGTDAGTPAGTPGNAGGAAIEPRALDPFLKKGIGWLVEAQHEDGGWGGGSHSRQDIRDPHAVKTDPGTTAFVAMALLRAGNTPLAGDHRDALRRATDYLLAAVEKAPADGPQITDITGTQPQSKLGQNVDTSLAAQYFTRLLPQIKGDAQLEARVTAALDKCVAKIQKSQKGDGSWNHGGWAPVLQSAMANNALEGARVAGRTVDLGVLERSRDYQKGNFDETTGEPSARASGSSAGVGLYAVASSQRAAAAEAKEAEDKIKQAQMDGKLPAGDIEVNQTNLTVAGFEAPKAEKLAKSYAQSEATAKALDSEQMLAGFGNNGGEEYLSYMMTSEALVIQGGDKFTAWQDKMRARVEKVQNGDGSWSGHHCITSPVFCTAAVVLCVTADRDAPFLVAAAQNGPKTAAVK